MHYRPRRSRYSPEQWQVYRERFQLEPDVPAPVDDATRPVRDVVQKMLTSLGITTTGIPQRLMEKWDLIAGQPLCRHTRPGSLEGNQLTIFVTNSPMLAELARFQGPALLKNIQDNLGASPIRRLRFLLDPDTRPGQRA